MANVNPIPEKFNSVNVSLIMKDARKALDFYTKAFGGEQGICLHGPGGKGIMHAEIHIGNSTIMIGEESPQFPAKSAETLGGSPAALHVYFDDVDAAFKRAIDAGCREVQPVMDMFWGDRFGRVADPFGYEWGMATHIKEVPPEEMDALGQQWAAEMAETS